MAYFEGQFFSFERKSLVSFTAVIPLEKVPSRGVITTGSHFSGPFPTLYLLHGVGGSQRDWVLRSRIEEWASQKGWAVIMPQGEDFFYLDNEVTGYNYGKFIGEELVEATRKMFNLSAHRQDTAIGGLSMGGYGALRTGLKYSGTFGHIIALSSALLPYAYAEMEPGVGNAVAPFSYYEFVFGKQSEVLESDRNPEVLAKGLVESGNSLPGLFLACGTEDFLYDKNLRLHVYFESIGYEHTWFTAQGVHDFNFWNLSLVEGLKTLPDRRG